MLMSMKKNWWMSVINGRMIAVVLGFLMIAFVYGSSDSLSDTETKDLLSYKYAYTQYFKEGFSGYIRHESYFDTRQVVGIAEDDVVVVPKEPVYDPNGEDIYAKGQFNQINITTRLRYFKRGPLIHCAKSLFFLETDFFGNTNTFLFNQDLQFIINILRMRHGFISLDWCNTELIAGYTWHPLYIFDSFPNTVSFGGGVPVAMYSRSPQTRATYHGEHVDVMGALVAQIDFPSIGPEGLAAIYLRRAVVPNLHAQVRFHQDGHVVGWALDFKRLIPRLVTKKGYKAKEHINSMIALFYYSLTTESLRLNTHIFYAQNANDMSVAGGFAVHSINPTTDRRTYTNLNTLNWWIDLTVTRFKHAEPGMFIGVFKNLGARKTIIPSITPPDEVTENLMYTVGANIDNTFIFGPRLRFLIKQFEMNGEVLWTRTLYGNIDRYGKVHDAKPTSDVRIFFGLTYYF